jgi:hypothetical protein
MIYIEFEVKYLQQDAPYANGWFISTELMALKCISALVNLSSWKQSYQANFT